MICLDFKVGKWTFYDTFFWMLQNICFNIIIFLQWGTRLDDVNLHYFTINFNGLFEYSDVSIWISTLT
jgi:hypothetical protein